MGPSSPFGRGEERGAFPLPLPKREREVRAGAAARDAPLLRRLRHAFDRVDHLFLVDVVFLG
jgi:hypothetical protein